jgi:hypothetical protein
VRTGKGVSALCYASLHTVDITTVVVSPSIPCTACIDPLEQGCTYKQGYVSGRVDDTARQVSPQKHTSCYWLCSVCVVSICIQIHWNRAARTDKGVSALCQVVSAKPTQQRLSPPSSPCPPPPCCTIAQIHWNHAACTGKGVLVGDSDVPPKLKFPAILSDFFVCTDSLEPCCAYRQGCVSTVPGGQCQADD